MLERDDGTSSHAISYNNPGGSRAIYALCVLKSRNANAGKGGSENSTRRDIIKRRGFRMVVRGWRQILKREDVSRAFKCLFVMVT